MQRLLKNQKYSFRAGEDVREFDLFRYKDLPDMKRGGTSREACAAITMGLNLGKDPLRELFFSGIKDVDHKDREVHYIGYECGQPNRDRISQCRKAQCPLREGKNVLAQLIEETEWLHTIALMENEGYDGAGTP